MTQGEHKILRGHLSKACIARDGGHCLRCGGTKRLCASHIYPKGRYPKMQYDLDNVKTLCFKCHIPWWHKNPMEAHEWLTQTIPKERLDRLKLRSQYVDKTPLDFKLIKIYLEKELEKHTKNTIDSFMEL